VTAAPAVHARAWALGAALAACLGAATFGPAFARLLWGHDPVDAFDVWMLHRLTHAWFAGEPLYTSYHRGANYPPASWLLLWPAFHPPSVETARWLWAACNLAAVAALAVQAARAIGQVAPAGRWLFLAAPWSLPAVTHAVSLGQTAIVVLPLAVGGILLAMDARRDWRRDLAAALLFDLALLKPSSTAPLFVVLAAAPGRWRPAALAAAGYALLTVAAATVQPEPLLTQLPAWLQRTERLGGRGYGSLQNALFDAGRADLLPVAALLVAAALAAWAWRARRADVWLLVGAAALTARLSVYHRVYDDALATLALIAVARVGLARGSSGSARPATPRARIAAVLLVLLATVLWMPVAWQSGRWQELFERSHVATFVAALAALGWWGIADSRARAAGISAAP
jgi:hypothetical protein